MSHKSQLGSNVNSSSISLSRVPTHLLPQNNSQSLDSPLQESLSKTQLDTSIAHLEMLLNEINCSRFRSKERGDRYRTTSKGPKDSIDNPRSEKESD